MTEPTTEAGLREALRRIADIHNHTEDCSIRSPLTGGYTGRPCNCDHDRIVEIVDAALAAPDPERHDARMDR